MGYSVGQYTSPDSSGVGTTQNNTGSTAQPAYGGKGGGTVTQPTTTTSNALAQPAQASTNPYATTVPAGAPTVKPTPTPVFGQNALGYNMGRLSRLMDPSASLPAPKPQTPQPQPQPQPQPDQAAPTGGKGGGYGVTADDLNALGAFLSMPADTFGNTNLAGYNNQDTSRDAYNRHMATAFYNGKPPTYEEWVQQKQSVQKPLVQKPYGPRYDEDNPYGVTGSQGTQQQNQQQDQQPIQTQANPFEGQTALYQQQMQQMQNMYQQQLDFMREQMKSMKDTGAEKYDLPKAYEDYGYTTTGEQEQATEKADTTQKLIKDVYSPGTRGADINDYFGNVLNMDRGIVVDKKGNIVVKDPLNPKGSGFTIAKGSTVDKDGNIISPTGKTISIPSRFLASEVDRAKYSPGIQKGDTIDEAKREYGSAGVNLTGAKIDSKGAVILKNGTKIPAGSYVDASGTLRSSSGAKVTVKAKDSASYVAPPKKTTKKKAHGGVIHNGMSNRLKHMLGED